MLCGQVVETSAGPDVDLATYVLHDDSRYLRLICDTIAATAERVVVEAHLKVVCGFRGKRGHRTWRKLKVRAVCVCGGGVRDGRVGARTPAVGVCTSSCA